MKRFMCILMACFLLLPMIPVHAEATEKGLTKFDEVVEVHIAHH